MLEYKIVVSYKLVNKGGILLNTTIIKKENKELEEAFLNYSKILDKKLEYKFSYLENWLLKQSNILLKETTQAYKLYRVYRRGTILKVDFGVGIGSEMSGIHFAIVLSNYDNNKNNVLTVIPLTSKKGKFNLNLGYLINDTVVDKFNKYIKKNSIKSNLINDLSVYYNKYYKTTYACCNLITTISKLRIIPGISKYDFIGKVKCSDLIMNIVDDEIRKIIQKSIDIK